MKKKIKLKNKKILWFSFVELIVVISIIALITIIWVSINTNYTEKSKNTKITWDIETIKNALESYKNDTNSLPLPSWNLKYYDDSANYVHFDEPTAFWVYGNISQNTLPKKYLDNLPLDPRTNQFYAYWKTLTWWLLYELSWVNKTNWNFESKVIWNYSWDTNWPYNLIREYNWPDFVYDKSLSNFPYNPSEKIITWKIWIFSWIIFVNWTKIDTNRIKDYELIAWDTVEVATWSTTEIYYSDWTKSVLWDPLRTSRINLTKLAYKDQYNLITKIQLALDLWTIWCSTSKLDKESEFEIYTTNTEVAVRWTIFWVTKSSTNKDTTTNATIVKWTIDIRKIKPEDLSLVTDKIDSNSIIYKTSTSSYSATLFPITLSIPIWTTPVSYITWTPPTLINNDWLTNIKPILKSIYNSEIKLEFPSSFSWANKIIKANNVDVTKYSTFSSNILTIKTLTWTNEITIWEQNEIKHTIPITVTTEINYNNKSSTCNSYETYFDWLWCITVDQDLYNSWFTLVAYAPYDTKWDLNMYRPNWEPITFSSWWNITFDDTYPDNKWIKIMSATSDWLAYSWSELWLWPDYAIEMSVRGEALNRNWSFYLFYNPSLYMRAWIIPPWKMIAKLDWINTFNFSNIISLNWFQNIIFKKYWTNQYINLKNTNYFIWNIANWYIIFKNDFYIWSLDTTYNKWNDIIDFIKIYHKK